MQMDSDRTAIQTKDFYDFTMTAIDGRSVPLAHFRNKVLLVVNVASECGLTPQYTGLESLFERYGEAGFAVLGFPANEFGAQEPGSDSEIAEFCRSTYGVKFPMFQKIVVKGEGQHPLYNLLISKQPHPRRKNNGGDAASEPKEGTGADQIRWNFEKFLIDRHGTVVARFSPDVEPEDRMIVAAIDAAIAAK